MNGEQQSVNINNYLTLAGLFLIILCLAICFIFDEMNPLQINVIHWVISAAIAAFLASLPGTFHLNLPMMGKAVGGFAVFLLLLNQNPQKLYQEYHELDENRIEYDTLIGRGNDALRNNNYGAAVDNCNHANKLIPNDWEALYCLGNAEFREGNFKPSFDYYKSAFNIEAGHTSDVAYAMAMSQEGLGDFTNSLVSANIAFNLAGTNLYQSNIIKYYIGFLHTMIWLDMNTELYSNTTNYENAVTQFNNYINSQGYPPHWANYHLACLYATRASDQSLESYERDRLEFLSNENLESAINYLENYNSEKAIQQKQMMRTILLQPDRYRRIVSNPIPCPQVRDIWMRSGNRIYDLASRLI